MCETHLDLNESNEKMCSINFNSNIQCSLKKKKVVEISLADTAAVQHETKISISLSFST